MSSSIAKESKCLQVSKKSKWSKLILLLAVTLVIFFVLFKNIDYRQVWDILKAANLRYLGIAVVISYIVNMVFHAYKWKYILEKMGYYITFRESLKIRQGSYPLHAMIPAKAGEFLRAQYMKKQGRMSFKNGASSILFMIALEFYFLLIIFFIASFFIRFNRFDIYIKAAGLFLILLTILFFGNKYVNRFVLRFMKRSKKVSEIYRETMIAFKIIKRQHMAYLVFITVMHWVFAFLMYFAILKALGVNISFVAVIFLIPMLLVLSQIPISLSGFGTREAFTVILFQNYGTAATMLSFGLLISLIDYVVPILIGLIYIKWFMERTL